MSKYTKLLEKQVDLLEQKNRGLARRRAALEDELDAAKQKTGILKYLNRFFTKRSDYDPF